MADVVLNVEICLNNRPLTYVEDDVELSVPMPNLMITGESRVFPDKEEVVRRRDEKEGEACFTV